MPCCKLKQFLGKVYLKGFMQNVNEQYLRKENPFKYCFKEKGISVKFAKKKNNEGENKEIEEY